MKIFLFCLWLLCAVIFAGIALIPNFMTIENNEDKMMHLTAFCLLMLGPVVVLSSKARIAAFALLLLALGAGVEAAQSYVPGREASLEDLAANIFGVLSGLLIGYLFRSGPSSPVSLTVRKN